MDEQPSQNPFDAFSKAGSTFALNEAKQYEFNVTGNSSTPLFNALAEDRKKEVMELAIQAAFDYFAGKTVDKQISSPLELMK